MFTMVFECIKTKRQDYMQVINNEDDDLFELKDMIKNANMKSTSNEFGFKSQNYRRSHLDNELSYISVDITEKNNHSQVDN